MLVTEFAIDLPFTAEQVARALRYAYLKGLEDNETGSGVQISLVKKEAVVHEGCEGCFTRKELKIGAQLPSWIQAVVGRDLAVTEECWSASRTCRPTTRRRTSASRSASRPRTAGRRPKAARTPSTCRRTARPLA